MPFYFINLLPTSLLYISILLSHRVQANARCEKHYVERATAVAQEQYKSLLAGLQAVGQVKGRKVQQIVFVGGTCGSIHVESFQPKHEGIGGP